MQRIGEDMVEKVDCQLGNFTVLRLYAASVQLL